MFNLICLRLSTQHIFWKQWSGRPDHHMLRRSQQTGGRGLCQNREGWLSFFVSFIKISKHRRKKYWVPEMPFQDSHSFWAMTNRFFKITNFKRKKNFGNSKFFGFFCFAGYPISQKPALRFFWKLPISLSHGLQTHWLNKIWRSQAPTTHLKLVTKTLHVYSVINSQHILPRLPLSPPSLNIPIPITLSRLMTCNWAI